MGQGRRRRERPPLDSEKLRELALAYVGRFATTRAKLRSYLGRKVRERGWAGQEAPDVDAIADRLASLGYVDDAAYALSKSRSLTGRGYGLGRVRQSLRAAGIGEQDSAPARAHAEDEKVESALRFARRRRIGPFAAESADRDQRQKALAAMVRAGHGFGLAKAILSLEPGSAIDLESLAENG
ncbi:MAG TPA: regulatory protein RecX [Sphingomicrobium sp.]|nr:regulatory protein RecX [Sphingomicrobium sp.]